MKYERDHKKVVTGLTLTSLSGAILLILVVLYPQNLFANRMLHGSFTVYSNAAIDEKITMVLDDALELVEHAEIYDPTYHYDIFYVPVRSTMSWIINYQAESWPERQITMFY